MNIVAHRNIFYTISTLLFVVSIGAVFLFGLRLGIDFTGGSLLGIEYPDSTRPSSDEIVKAIAPFDLGEARIQPTGEKGFLIRLKHIDEPTHQAILSSLGSKARELEFTTVGPTIGSELRQKSGLAVVLVILLIVIYIAWAFRKVSEPIASWKYGATTIVALVHDIVIPAGFFAVAGHYLGYEVDTLFVTAILTILGFSVHDTIVVFDRIRENLKKYGQNLDFSTIVSKSVAETIVRSLNTSCTVVLALLAVYLFGGETTKVFSLTLIIGIAIGTYSSISIASPLLVTWHEMKKSK